MEDHASRGSTLTPEALILTSDFELSHMVRLAVERFGITAGFALQTDDAVGHLEKKKFDLVVVDCSDLEQGCGALRKMRLNRTHRSVVSIAIVGDRGHSKYVSDSGANFVISHANYEVEIVATLRSAYGLVLRERGRYNRFPSAAAVTVRCAEFVAEARVLNISQGGVCISGIERPLSGQVQLKFALQDGGIPIQISGTPAWQRDKSAGIQFASMTKATRAELEEWLARQFEIETKVRGYLPSVTTGVRQTFASAAERQNGATVNSGEIHPIITAIIRGGPVSARCSSCQVTITFGNTIGVPLEQERKLRDAFLAHLEDKHKAEFARVTKATEAISHL
jgi:hypothetical protein